MEERLEINRERGKGIQGYNIKSSAIMDDWYSVPLRPSEDLIRCISELFTMRIQVGNINP